MLVVEVVADEAENSRPRWTVLSAGSGSPSRASGVCESVSRGAFTTCGPRRKLWRPRPLPPQRRFERVGVNEAIQAYVQAVQAFQAELSPFLLASRSELEV